MGDRLAVMRAGSVEQCGVPIDVYDHPCNLFVAQFVGTPTMNVLAASVVESAGRIELCIGPHRSTIDVDQLRARPIWWRLVGRELALGVRPEEVRPDVDGWLVGSVVSTELLERRQLVTFDVDVRAVTDVDGRVVVDPVPRTSLVAAVDPDLSVSRWEPFRVTLDLDRVHLFDLATGLALD
jgi:multiple sugar transport system ATP-binding protein